ncbi:hypothetical protein K2173_024058 [Erythroxylum novogranatense]|uniref:Reverse transcriptase Ty1/copia-type domain-containing protein n=1 Tax=Erythroxylum novogranatense TaxID=1862640 RepID=A0AAV8TQ54_9ROSI|nr:hypothetical protein K2173_024058 [Erythroxylum novogranatense]
MDVQNAFLHGNLNEEVYMKMPPGFASENPGKVCRLHDLIISGNDAMAVQKFKNYLSSCFHMKDLGRLKYFLGIEVARNAEGIFLSKTPLEQNHKLALIEGEDAHDPAQYRRLVGRLIYLTITRPELSYCVHVLAQFMQQPKKGHWEAALRVSDLNLYAYCDSDWASCPLTRRSVTGYFICLGTSPVSWKTKKQQTVSRSSAEAEYRSMTTASCELKWLKGLLRFLGVDHSRSMRLSVIIICFT